MKKITLTKGKTAIVDDADYDSLIKHRWTYQPSLHTGYAVRNTSSNGVRKYVYMHRQIIKAPSNKHVDHINRNGLDNRTKNLRLCTPSENLHNSKTQHNNTSGYRGVCYDKSRGLFMSYINMNGKRKYLGRYETASQASRARDKVIS